MPILTPAPLASIWAPTGAGWPFTSTEPKKARGNGGELRMRRGRYAGGDQNRADNQKRNALSIQ